MRRQDVPDPSAVCVVSLSLPTVHQSNPNTVTALQSHHRSKEIHQQGTLFSFRNKAKGTNPPLSLTSCFSGARRHDRAFGKVHTTTAPVPKSTGLCVTHTHTNTTPYTMRSPSFVGRCVVTAAAVASLQASQAGAFAPPAFVPSGPASLLYCRSCSSAASAVLPRSSSSSSSNAASKQQQARAWGAPRRAGARSTVVTRMSSTDIESPFASPGMAEMGEGDEEDKDALLTLTLENVETVLDEMRPYLMSDG